MAVNHYRDNAITYSPARQNARELPGERGIHDMQMRHADVAAPDAKWRHYEGVAIFKAKMMLCVMMLPLVVVGCTSAVCRAGVKPPPPPAWIMQPPDWQTPLNGLFHPQREADHFMQKQLEGTQKYINEQCRYELPIDGQLMQLL